MTKFGVCGLVWLSTRSRRPPRRGCTVLWLTAHDGRNRPSWRLEQNDRGIYVSVRWTASVRKKNEDPSAANRATLEQRKPNSRQRRSKRRLENFLARKKAAVGLPGVQAERQSGRSTVELEDRFSQNCQSTETLDSRTYASVVAKNANPILNISSLSSLKVARSQQGLSDAMLLNCQEVVCLKRRIVTNVGKYQNGTSYTRVSARHNWDARAPLRVNVSQGFRAKNGLSPSSLPFHCRSWGQVFFATFDRVRVPTLFPTIINLTLLKLPHPNRNHRRKLYSTRSSTESCSSLLSAGVRSGKKNFRSGQKERTKKKEKN